VPSFELWLLLHYEDVQCPIHRSEVLKRLKIHIPGYEKGARGAWQITRDRLSIATQRAEALSAKSDRSMGKEPYTAVGELVGVLAQLRI